MLARMVLGWRQAARLGACTRGPRESVARVFSTSQNADAAQWDDFNNVVKELRRIAREEGIHGALPDTKLLKELGHKELVLAIRKKHGGFVSVASKIGLRVEKEDLDIQKKITARANRRKKREMRVAKHDFY